MATSTTNLGLTKPAVNDAADIGVLNSNFDKIDAKFGANYCADCNNATKNGWYRFDANTLNIAPTASQGSLFVRTAESSSGVIVYQTMWNGYWRAYRFYDPWDGTWAEWEFENPPMQLGVEYRTMERWNGSVVYVKMLDCGELSSTDQKLVTFASETTASAFQLYGRAYRSGGNMITLPYGEAILISGDNNRVMIHTKGVSSGWYAYVGVKYTK